MAIYCRAPGRGDQLSSSAAQETELRGAVPAPAEVAVLTDIGPGLSARRKGLARLLGAVRGGRVGTVHVTQRDRLPRSGVGFIGRIFDD